MQITTANGFFLHTGILGNEEHSNKVLKHWDGMRKWLILLRKKRHYVFVPLVPQKLNLAVWFYVSRSRTTCSRRMVRCFWTLSVPSERSKRSVVIIPHRIRSSRKCAMLNIYISEAVSTRNSFFYISLSTIVVQYMLSKSSVFAETEMWTGGEAWGGRVHQLAAQIEYTASFQQLFFKFYWKCLPWQKNPAWVLGFW